MSLSRDSVMVVVTDNVGQTPDTPRSVNALDLHGGEVRSVSDWW